MRQQRDMTVDLERLKATPVWRELERQDAEKKAKRHAELASERKRLIAEEARRLPKLGRAAQEAAAAAERARQQFEAAQRAANDAGSVWSAAGTRYDGALARLEAELRDLAAPEVVETLAELDELVASLRRREPAVIILGPRLGAWSNMEELGAASSAAMELRRRAEGLAYLPEAERSKAIAATRKEAAAIVAAIPEPPRDLDAARRERSAAVDRAQYEAEQRAFARDEGERTRLRDVKRAAKRGHDFMRESVQALQASADRRAARLLALVDEEPQGPTAA